MSDREKAVALGVHLFVQVCFLLAFGLSFFGGDMMRAIGWGALGYLNSIEFELRRKRQGF